MNLLKTFLTNEDGAVTVDWFVLTSFTIGFATLIATTVLVQIETVGVEATDQIDAIQTGENFGS